MKKITFSLTLLLLTALFAPQLAFGYCPQTDKVGWNFSDALLYWEAYEHGLGFTTKPSDILTTDDFTHKKVVNPTYKWEWGFRLGIGYTPCERDWTFQAYWTHLDSRAHGNKTVNSDTPDWEGIFPIWSLSEDTLPSDYVSAARSSWRLHTNIGDLYAEYNWMGLCDNKLILMPFLGIRGVGLTQSLKVKYSGGTFFSGVDYNKLHSRYYGVGPRGGLMLDYYIACGISAFCRGAITPLFGAEKLHLREKYFHTERYRDSNEKYKFMLSTDYAVGLRWRGLILDNWPFFILSVSWEGQEFFFANQFTRSRYNFFSKHRGLFLQGVTLEATIDF